MEVKMFRILVSAKVREHPACTAIGFDLGCNAAYDSHDSHQQLVWLVTKIGEGRNMTLGDNHNVHRPERSGVMECQQVSSLADDVDTCTAADCLIAIEILSHRQIMTSFPLGRNDDLFSWLVAFLLLQLSPLSARLSRPL
jgi:hypothetical protein